MSNNGYDEYVATQNLLKAVGDTTNSDDLYLVAAACLKKMAELNKPHVLAAVVTVGVKELSNMAVRK